MPSSDDGRYGPPEGVTHADAFEMGFSLAMSLRGQTMEDSRAVGRLLDGRDFEAVSGRVEEILRRDGFDSFAGPDHGVFQTKRILRIALGADEPPIDHDITRTRRMTIATTATIYHAEGIRFDDLQALDEELMAQSGECLATLYSGGCALLPGWNGPFVIDPDGELLVADAGSGDRCRYGSRTRVGGNWSRQVTEAVARHLVAGELVIEIVEDGQPYEYVVVTPDAFDVRDDYQ